MWTRPVSDSSQANWILGNYHATVDDDTDPDGNPFGDIPFLGGMTDFFGTIGADPWIAAKQIATQIATGGKSEDNVDPSARISYERLCRVAELNLADHIELPLGLGAAPVIRPATRHEWAANTLEAFRPILTSLSDGLKSGLAAESAGDLSTEAAALGLSPDLMAQIFKMLSPMMFSMTSGSMVGQLARTSFGSHDLPVPRKSGLELLVVHRNVEDFASQWSVPIDDMRLWVCIHEYLRFSVLRLPHVHSRLSEIIGAYVAGFDSSPVDVGEKFASLNPADPESFQSFVGDPQALLGIVRSDDQDALLPTISAMLSAIVGWVDYYLDVVAQPLMSSYDSLSEALKRRRVSTNSADRFIEQMMGFQLDQACYDQGRSFVSGVVKRAGEAGLKALWRPDGLPTPNEIVAPGLWLARLDIEQAEVTPSDVEGGDVDGSDGGDVDGGDVDGGDG